MEETGQWECPFYHRVVGEDECYDLHLVAMRMFDAPELVREEDRGPLNAMCEECKKYLKTNRMSLNEAQTAYSQGEEIY